MIKSLSIENFVIVEKLELNFSKGLQILSGETGAGKSIVVGAIQLSLGGSVRNGMLFDKDKPAIIETVFKIDKNNRDLTTLINKYEIDTSENEIYFRKEISTNLRGKSFVNGRRVSNSIIKEFNNVFIDFHGQRDQQKLFDNEYQLELIDKYGDIIPDRDKFGEFYYQTLRRSEQLNKLQKSEEQQREKMKLYEYQLIEIAEIGLQENEDEKLQSELNLLTHAEDIINCATELEQDVYEKEHSIYDAINLFIFRLSEFEKDNEHIAKGLSLLRDSAANLEEAVEEIRDLQGIIEFDTVRMESVQNRLNELNNLKMKYKMNISEIMKYSDKIELELKSFSSNKENIGKLQQLLDEDLNKLNILAEKLSRKRISAAKLFEKELMQNIRELAIPDAMINIKFDKQIKYSNSCLRDYSNNGIDEVEIYFSANKGKEVQPLKLAASGGELSRFMLAVKKILSDKLSQRTVIFDEIDTGIGGKTAELLGEFIYEISKYHQVVCITHLAQIAAFANKHYAIYKKDTNSKTVVDIRYLDLHKRKNEIARMMSGSNSEIALKYADEILTKLGEQYD